MTFKNIFLFLTLGICILIFSFYYFKPSEYIEPSVNINAGGATFPYPVYSKWASDYKDHTGNLINYQPNGSGAGIKGVKEGIIDFGGTDMPLSEEELIEFNLMQFPTLVGAIVPIFNLPENDSVNFSGQVLVKIFSGDITKWNDPLLLELNPNIELPNLDIVVTYRSEGSGTTYAWLTYLARHGSNLGVNTSINWPTGIGSKGNAGVASTVSQLSGSIGYVEYTYAKENNIKIGLIDNINASTETFINSTWPVLAQTYILVPNDSLKKEEILKFFDWASVFGKQTAIDLDYIPVER